MVFERFTYRARQVVVLAQEEARRLKHTYIGTEHILLGLLREDVGVAARALESLDVTGERVRGQVVRIVGSGEVMSSGQIPFTPRAKRVLESSQRESLSSGHNYIDSGRPLRHANNGAGGPPDAAAGDNLRSIPTSRRPDLETVGTASVSKPIGFGIGDT